jgi:SPP1 family predicted phage head-tail adaptor
MLHGEFPHEIEVLVKEKVSDGAGGFTSEWEVSDTLFGFIDTPSSREKYNALQLQNPLDRFLYYPYRTDINAKVRVKYESDMYELSGRPEDQGGQHEIMRVALKLVTV